MAHEEIYPNYIPDQGLPEPDPDSLFSQIATGYIDSRRIRLGKIRVSQLEFVPLKSVGTEDDIVATINATTEGLAITAGLLNITGTTVFFNSKDLAGNINEGTTTISGGKITTNTITANEIAANTITGNEISSLVITGKTLIADTGTIGGWQIGSNVLTGSNAILDANFPGHIRFKGAASLGSAAGVRLEKSNDSNRWWQMWFDNSQTLHFSYQQTAGSPWTMISHGPGGSRFWAGAIYLGPDTAAGTALYNQLWGSDFEGSIEVFARRFYPSGTAWADLGTSTRKWKDLYVSGVADIHQMKGFLLQGHILPTASSSYDLGSSSLPFRKLYVDSLAFGTIGQHLIPSLNSTYDLGSSSYKWRNLYVDNLVFGSIGQSLIPSSDDTYDLGSSFQQWRNLYIDGVAYIDAIGENLLPSSSDVFTLGSSARMWKEVYTNKILGLGTNNVIDLGIPDAIVTNKSYVPSTHNTIDLGVNTQRWKNIYGVNIFCTNQTADQHVTGDLNFKYQGKIVFRVDETPKYLNFYNRDNQKIAILDSEGNLWLKGRVKQLI